MRTEPLSSGDVDRLLDLAYAGDIDGVAALLESGLDVNAANHLGWNASVLAAWGNQERAFKWLGKHGGEVPPAFVDVLEILRLKKQSCSGAFVDLLAVAAATCDSEGREDKRFDGVVTFEIGPSAWNRNEKFGKVKGARRAWGKLNSCATSQGFSVYQETGSGVVPQISVVSSSEKFVPLLLSHTSAIDYGADTFEIIRSLKGLDSKFPFQIRECSRRSLGLDFGLVSGSSEQTVRYLVENLGFGVDEDDSEALLESISKDGVARLWWD